MMRSNLRSCARIRPGARLGPAVLAEALFSSVTRVRDALHMLTGEGLVETAIDEGFRIPQVDGHGLSDLYAWNGAVLLLATRGWPRVATTPEIAASESSDSAECAAALFLRIARRSTNVEHGRVIAMTNDRLHAARMVEESVLSDTGAELAALAGAHNQGDSAGLRLLLRAYHRRRARTAAEIVRRLYRTDDGELPI